MARCTRLKNGFLFQRPSRGRIAVPRVQPGHNTFDLAEILLVVGAKIETRALPCPTRNRVEKIRLQKPVFVVPGLGPRVGEQHPDFAKSHTRRESVKALTCLGAEKVAVGQFGAVAFSSAPRQPIENQVDPEAKLARMRLCVAHQKMPVPTADFPDDRLGLREQLGEIPAQRGPAFVNSGKELGFESHSARVRRAGPASASVFGPLRARVVPRPESNGPRRGFSTPRTRQLRQASPLESDIMS
jgi:hypothetical protein